MLIPKSSVFLIHILLEVERCISKCYWRLVLMTNVMHKRNWHQLCGQVGVAAFDLRSASLHLSQYIETSSSYQNTKTLLHFYDPMVIIVTPNKLAPEGMVGVSELVDRFCTTVKKVMVLNDYLCTALSLSPSLTCLCVNLDNQIHMCLPLWVIFICSRINIIYCFVKVVMARGCFNDTKVMTDTYSPLVFKILGADTCIHFLEMMLWFCAPGCCAD